MMQVVEINAFGPVENLVLTERKRIEPAAGEVLIKIKATAVNPIDYKMRRGLLGGELPMVLGHDLAGTVVELGDDVTGLHEGEQVWSYLGGPKSNGAYAQYVSVPREFVSRKPINLNFLEAAAVPLTGLTAYEAVFEKAKVQPGQSVLITGASGGVGSMAVQMCLMQGARVLATAGSERSRDYCTRVLGVPEKQVISYRNRSLEELEMEIYRKNEGRSVDIAFDFVGHRIKQLCLRVIGFGGSVVSIVEEPSEVLASQLFDARNSPLFTKSASMHFQFLGARALFGGRQDWLVYQRELETLCEWMEAGRLKPPLVGDLGNFSEASIQGAHRLLEEGDVHGKLVVRFSDSGRRMT
ncbi:NADP-dependent oxidoreductase [bacterium]|nr:NADP-dependent oxidoreductase [bacterium]